MHGNTPQGGTAPGPGGMPEPGKQQYNGQVPRPAPYGSAPAHGHPHVGTAPVPGPNMYGPGPGGMAHQMGPQHAQHMSSGAGGHVPAQQLQRGTSGGGAPMPSQYQQQQQQMYPQSTSPMLTGSQQGAPHMQPFVPGPSDQQYYSQVQHPNQQQPFYASSLQPQQQQPQQQQQHFKPQPQQPQFFIPGPPMADGAGGGGGMPDMSPLGFMVAGSNLLNGNAGSWGQQYVQSVQQRMSWLSGTALNVYFAVNSTYVSSKLGMLFAPFLKRWTFTRQADQSGQQFQTPKTDISAPDLYIPIMALWTYVVSLCGLQLTQNKFKPDIVYSTVWNASAAWVFHALVASMILRAMNIQTSVPWLDLFAYTGYSFVLACFVLGVGFVGGTWAYYAALLYGGLCMSVFLVRTMKRIMFAEARNYGRDLTATNYLLLSLALFQFPFAFWLTSVKMPVVSALLKAAFPTAYLAANVTGSATGEM